MSDVPAQYPGGIQKFFEYTEANLQYPDSARLSGVTGVVYVTFVVLQDGSIDQASMTITQPLTADCDAEAKRLVKGGGVWVPASSNGQHVPYVVTVPVVFTIKEEQ